MRTATTLIRLGWAESSLGANVILLVLSRGGSFRYAFYQSAHYFNLHPRIGLVIFCTQEYDWSFLVFLFLFCSCLQFCLEIVYFASAQAKQSPGPVRREIRGRFIWAATWQNQQNGCAPSEDSDQPGHPPSLIRVFAPCMKKALVLSYKLSAQRRLWSDWHPPSLIRVFAGRTLILLVLSCRGSFNSSKLTFFKAEEIQSTAIHCDDIWKIPVLKILFEKYPPQAGCSLEQLYDYYFHNSAASIQALIR